MENEHMQNPNPNPEHSDAPKSDQVGRQVAPEPEPETAASASVDRGAILANADKLFNDPKSAYWNEGRTPDEKAAHDRAVAEVFAANQLRYPSDAQAEAAEAPTTEIMERMQVKMPESNERPNPDSVNADADLRQFVQFSEAEGIPGATVTRMLNSWANVLMRSGGDVSETEIAQLEAEYAGSLHPKTIKQLSKWLRARVREGFPRR